ncbi:hypothetical protein B0I35DRAFT_75611 [Stachybotrys elegans]|uniref:Uncharacterized protein n=1 Tax=Stachybotrys elegans TaxID=80388 RepID=A0A8K0SII6_9HYPO|nr:hypothetical protein B0I35DRAFT_75611 [Stachybotrys elegans]
MCQCQGRDERSNGGVKQPKIDMTCEGKLTTFSLLLSLSCFPFVSLTGLAWVRHHRHPRFAGEGAVLVLCVHVLGRQTRRRVLDGYQPSGLRWKLFKKPPGNIPLLGALLVALESLWLAYANAGGEPRPRAKHGAACRFVLGEGESPR